MNSAGPWVTTRHGEDILMPIGVCTGVTRGTAVLQLAKKKKTLTSSIKTNLI